jgi:hypothetical protein
MFLGNGLISYHSRPLDDAVRMAAFGRGRITRQTVIIFRSNLGSSFKVSWYSFSVPIRWPTLSDWSDERGIFAHSLTTFSKQKQYDKNIRDEIRSNAILKFLFH